MAARAHAAIVCEGQPLRPELAPATAERLARRLGPPGLPSDLAVAAVAAAYDYDARRGPAVFVLTKRYTDPADLPDVPFDEALAALQNIQTATRNFGPSENPSQALRRILTSATPEQRARLAQGVPVSDLPADWQREAWQLACGHSFAPLQYLAYATGRLQACRQHSTVFLHQQYLNLPFLAYQGPWAAGGATDFFALSGWVDTTAGGGTTLDIAPGLRLVDGKEIIVTPGTVDPTTPRPAGSVPPVAASALRVSLAEAARRLSGRLAADGSGEDASGLRAVQVAPALAPKAVCVAGEGNAPPGALLGALAAAYGLEVTRERDTATLGQPRPRVLDDPAAVGAEVRRLLPAPYVRAVTPPAPSDPAGSAAPDPAGGYSSARADALYVAAVRRLRELVEPQMARREDGRMPVPDAGAEARSLVALSGWLKCVPELPILSNTAGAYLSHFSQDTLTLAPGGALLPLSGRLPKGLSVGGPPGPPNPNAISFRILYQGGPGPGSGVSGMITFPPGTFE